jgi:hypothetical protein
MKQTERLRRIVDYRFPAWLAALVVLGLVVAIKLMIG